MENARTIKISYTDEYGVETEYRTVESGSDLDNEVEWLLDRFKYFLKACSFHEVQVSHIQYVEDDDWKNLLTSWGEWTEEMEEAYLYSQNKDNEEC